MNDKPNPSRWGKRVALATIVALYVVMSIVGITWGLPSRDIDKFLFGDEPVWSGEKIYKLAGARDKFSRARGADVDVDPIAEADDPVLLTATDEDVAKIYLRYRLYTHQPDEMITMMALAGMRPGRLDLDPRLYQYGGLFIYPVGALIKACDVVGLIDVRSNVAYYLDHPDEFAKFYVVARAYAAAWGLIGLLIVYGIACRLGGQTAGLLAALLFALMPVVVCMAHEGKPHLPGAVLMLAAVYFAMRAVETRPDDTAPDKRGRYWWAMCICCGAAFGMVLSSLPIFILIPLVAWQSTKPDVPQTDGERPRVPPGRFVARTVIGCVIGVLTYLVCNPYIVINAVANQAVLRSNFGNSLAMYEIARIVEGFTRVVELTIEGATLPVLLLGTASLVAAIVRKKKNALPLALPAIVLFVQFVLIGAGKPAEYGRFGVFTNTALVIGTACLLGRSWHGLSPAVRWIVPIIVIIIMANRGVRYLWNFHLDAGEGNSRIMLARGIQELDQARPAETPTCAVAVLADPAPYCCPPMNFAVRDVYLVRDKVQMYDATPGRPALLIHPTDRRKPTLDEVVRRTSAGRWRWIDWPGATPISWANKPFNQIPKDVLVITEP